MTSHHRRVWVFAYALSVSLLGLALPAPRAIAQPLTGTATVEVQVAVDASQLTQQQATQGRQLAQVSKDVVQLNEKLEQLTQRVNAAEEARTPPPPPPPPEVVEEEGEAPRLPGAGPDPEPRVDEAGAVAAFGFSRFTLPDDARVVFVSSSDGSDSNDGFAPDRALKTPRRGYDKLRDGRGDWLLFKAGDTFLSNLGTMNKSGRNAIAPLLIGVYGEGDRPHFLAPGGVWADKPFNATADHVAFVGLRVTAVNRDPSRADFQHDENLRPKDVLKQLGIRFLGDARNLLIEDCVLEYFLFGIILQSDERSGEFQLARINRTVVRNSYGHWDDKFGGHSSGIFASHVNGLTIEQSVFDHNGWNPHVNGAGRTKFNHNLYIQHTCRNVAVLESIITRAASHGLQLRPGGEVNNNLIVRNALGFFVAIAPSLVVDNVVLHSDDIGDDKEDWRGSGMDVLPCLKAIVRNNIFSQKDGKAPNMSALKIAWEKGSMDKLNGQPYRVTLKDNKIHQWPFKNGSEPSLRLGTPSAIVDDQGGNLMDKASGGESDPQWIDPGRDVASYVASLKGDDAKSPSLETFVNHAATRPRGTWESLWSADTVNDYIRAGFVLKD